MSDQQQISRQGISVAWQDLAVWGTIGAALGLTALATKVDRADRWGMLAAVAAAALVANRTRRTDDDRSATESVEVAKLEELLEQVTSGQVLPIDRARGREPVG